MEVLRKFIIFIHNNKNNMNIYKSKIFLISIAVLFFSNHISQAQIKKFYKVMDSLNERTKNEITNVKVSTFLRDLKKVLDADKDNLLILVDKKHSLPKEYTPTNIITLITNNYYKISRLDLSLSEPAFDALSNMSKAAKLDGITLLIVSSYRSYDYQDSLYKRKVKRFGKEYTDRVCAKAGNSQHQLGTVVDIGAVDNSFAETKAGKWLLKNASEYGWSLSFPKGYESVTGYTWESWHYRYIGKEAAEFQKKYFSDVQQFMLEFIDAWKNTN
ncbi:M15 family metallopeptidase [Brachyspira pilosicoli]|uniref:M15 family metallopeptidase n=1 Tax=Brachyspira pilosicoli TaxID=52584 RepID=UPI000CB29524|nr:M15 family metallopeptidase [Brachyspira pilosicoli]PLV63618.1 peptidase M15 [Brachyspira pilosicoli SP16]